MGSGRQRKGSSPEERRCFVRESLPRPHPRPDRQLSPGPLALQVEQQRERKATVWRAELRARPAWKGRGLRGWDVRCHQLLADRLSCCAAGELGVCRGPLPPRLPPAAGLGCPSWVRAPGEPAALPPGPLSLVLFSVFLSPSSLFFFPLFLSISPCSFSFCPNVVSLSLCIFLPFLSHSSFLDLFISVTFLSPSCTFSLFLNFLSVCLFQPFPSFCVLQEFGQAPGVSDGQGSLACCSLWGCKESDMTERLN